MVLKKYATSLRKYPNGSADRLIAPKKHLKSGKRYQNIEDDGLIAVGSRVQPSDVLVHKQTPMDTIVQQQNDDNIVGESYRDSPLVYKAPNPAYISKGKIFF